MDSLGETKPKALTARPIYNNTACGWCKLFPPHRENLKRCQGCEVTFYCGKECQKSAWPTHRPPCRSRKEGMGETKDLPLGYTTTIALMDAVGEWTEIHKYALTVIAHTAVRATGGVEANLRQGRLIVFVLEPRPPRQAGSASADVDPASAFILSKINNPDAEHAELEHVVPPLRKLISETFGRRGIEGGFRGDSHDAIPAGFVPVVCIVEGGTSPPTMLRFPLYRPSRHPDDAADEKTVGFFADLRGIFFCFVNNGIVIRAPKDGQIGAPPCGVMVRAKKGWRWQQNQRLWQRMDMAVPYQNPPLQTAGSATELWTRFQQW